MKKVNAIIEARMGSTRLPGKTLFQIMGRPVLDLLIERLSWSKRIDQIIVAAPTNKEDDVIEEFCDAKKIACYRGSSEDVLGRVYHAAKKFDTDIIVEVTGDCPLLDPWLIDDCLELYMRHDYDYLSNFIEQSYPPGIDVQIFSFDVLKGMHTIAKEPKYREHVSLYILKNPQKYRIHNVTAPEEFSYPDWHIELDEMKDFELIKRIYEALYPRNPQFSTLDIIHLLKRNPDWLLINKDIKRTWEQARKEENVHGTH